MTNLLLAAVGNFLISSAGLLYLLFRTSVALSAGAFILGASSHQLTSAALSALN